MKNILLEAKSQGKTILISSHILSDIESLCDHIAIIKSGSAMATGTLDDLLSTSKKMRITTANVPAEAVSELGNLSAEITGSGTTFEIDLPGSDRIYDAIDILRRYGCRLISVAPLRTSLEDVFFSLVKGETPQ